MIRRVAAKQKLTTGGSLTIVVLALFVMFVLMLSSMSRDSLTFDELAHIVAGYTYLTEQDYRINPEHPPLIKDLAALPLLGMDLKFPIESQNWRMDAGPPPWWVQFDLGREFLYRSGNNPVAIIFAARLPMLALTIVLGLFLFYWARRLGGNWMAVGVLLLFVFSPTFLAHGRLVTTDIGVALAVALAIYAWLKFLERPASPGRIAAAAVTFGFALLIKFSTILLLPLFAILVGLRAWLFFKKKRGRALGRLMGWSVVVGLVMLGLVIAPIYAVHIKNYPADRQVRDTIADLQPDGLTGYEKALGVFGADKPGLRSLSQFFRGVLMAGQRVQFGNTVYLLGQVKATAFWYYFPVIYFLKEPLALHGLTVLGLVGVGLSVAAMRRKQLWQRVGDWMREHFTLVALLVFILIYWAVALVGNLNIGVRHVLVTFPLIYLITMWGIQEWYGRLRSRRARQWLMGGVVVLFGFYLASSLSAFPTYLSYYNVLGGGEDEGYKVAVDSNYDWGQDFRELAAFVEEEKIEQIAVDYFGGEDQAYWLGDRYVQLHPRDLAAPPAGWVAVSLNQLMGGVATPVQEEGIPLDSGYYNWLAGYEPVERIGKTIFVYYFEEAVH